MNTSPHLVKPSAAAASRTWSRLLSLGVVLAPFFLLLAVAQMLTRPGFDISRHAVSSLQNGSFGWIQSGNFVISGVLALLFAWGARQALRGGRGRTWAPILFIAFGLGMVVAGFFPPDPAFGFPEGAPPGMPDGISTTGALHTAGFFAAFIALIASCFVMARHFGSRASNWRAFSVTVGIATPLLIVLGNVLTEGSGIFYLAAGAVSFIWLSAVAGRLLSDVSPRANLAEPT